MTAIGTMTLNLAYEGGKFVGNYRKVATNGEMASGTLPEIVAGNLAAMTFPSQVQQAVASAGDTAASTTPTTPTTTTPSTSAGANATVAATRVTLTVPVVNLKVTL